MARTDPTIYMRIPQELKDALDKASLENRRSLTAEVVARLQASFAPASQGSRVEFELGGPIVHRDSSGKMHEVSMADFVKAIATEIKKKPGA